MDKSVYYNIAFNSRLDCSGIWHWYTPGLDLEEALEIIKEYRAERLAVDPTFNPGCFRVVKVTEELVDEESLNDHLVDG